MGGDMVRAARQNNVGLYPERIPWCYVVEKRGQVQGKVGAANPPSGKPPPPNPSKLKT